MKKGHKPEFLTVAKIAGALAGEILLADYTGKSKIVYEHYFRQTVVEVANSRGFQILPEYPLKKESNTVGARKRIDYVLSYANQQIAIEIKVVKGGNSIPDLKEDIEKLKKLTSQTLKDDEKRFKTSNWIIILWRLVNKDGKNITAKMLQSDIKNKFDEIKKKLRKQKLVYKKNEPIKTIDLRINRKQNPQTIYVSEARIDKEIALCYFFSL